MIKKLLQKLLSRMGYTVTKRRVSAEIARDVGFQEIFQMVKPYTMVSTDRSYALYQAMSYVIKNNIPGDIVECGVWRGGQAMLMAEMLARAGDTGRTIWLYDTYTGMSEPTKEDVYAYPDAPAKEKWQSLVKDGYTDWCYASLDEVKANVGKTAYPKDRFMFVKGKVEDTIPGTLPQQIALLRLDTDFYESTKHELKHLMPLLTPGGVLLIDDYGSWAGARQAVDEYFASEKPKVFLAPAGQQGKVGIKVS